LLRAANVVWNAILIGGCFLSIGSWFAFDNSSVSFIFRVKCTFYNGQI